jgi:putative ATPase
MELNEVMDGALRDRERGLGNYPAELTEDARAYLLAASGGDARIMLNALEIAVLTTAPSAEGVRTVDLETMVEALQRRSVHYDKGGEEHYNFISALHKSVRGSDPDAALYWLARMLDAGEDPLYIGRRLVRMATEDIGLADPFALVHAMDAVRSFEFVGSPEGELALAQTAVYLALAPKSNSVYRAFDKASELAKKTGMTPVPMHLRNAPTGLLKKLGYGKDYQYPHDEPDGWVADNYLPGELEGADFYDPTNRGWEGRWKQTFEERRRKVRDLARGRGGKEQG